jgi:hypothetical protein
LSVKVFALAAGVVSRFFESVGAAGWCPGAAVARTTFRSASALVALNVTVQDRGAKFVRDLQLPTSSSTRTG